MDIRLVQAVTAEQIAVARSLFEEYAAWLGFDLEFQDFATELATLPGAYAPPRGRLLLAEAVGPPDGTGSAGVGAGVGAAGLAASVAGCGALRPLEDDVCEMKRLYVRPAFRGHRVGRLLAVALVDEARSIGYGRMRLDTLDTMTEATRLYRSMG
ncbi:MAG TPA: GNAT family N-acetyltransferase, partial [Methylomirabilota bacterium]|nr:GNAT family N-acetyltransferase [Methylomirabilota bacterium]